MNENYTRKWVLRRKKLILTLNSEQVIEHAKKDWPELVGTDGQQAAQKIRDERPDLSRVEVLAADS